MKRHTKQNGFTLIELIVVIAIIAILSAVVIGSVYVARERAAVNSAVSQIKELQNSLSLFYTDNETYTATCMSDIAPICDASNDPLLNSLGLPNWRGPYIKDYKLRHPWGGHTGFMPMPDGAVGFLIFLNDDRPQTSSSDNGGQIPTQQMIDIDEALDDGNLNTGNMVGNGGAIGTYPATSAGEMMLVYLP